MKSKQWLLASRPQGEPTAANWQYQEVDAGDVAQGQIKVKVQYISLDPAMRGWMNDGKSYIEPVQIGDVMRAGAVGEVLESNAEGFSVGDKVYGSFGVQSVAVCDTKGVHKVDPSLAPLERYLGVLGMPGMTAYFGLLKTGLPEAGETGRSCGRNAVGRWFVQSHVDCAVILGLQCRLH